MNYEYGSDEYARANVRLHEIESEIEDIEKKAIPDNKKGWDWDAKQSEIKDESDHSAIMQMAHKLKPEMEKLDPIT